MSNDQKGLELKVGVFVFIGLMAIAIMAVQFGRVGQGLAKTYQLKVEFPNASGLLKNSDVQLAGSAIGNVADRPTIMPGQIGSVTVTLNIKEAIQIPRGCIFKVGSSGMLGDKYVEIIPPEGFDQKNFNPADPEQTLQAGDTVKGDESKDLTKAADETMTKLNARLDELKITMDEVNTKLPQLLSSTNIQNLQDTFASLKTSGENFAAASKKIDDVVTGAQSAVESAKTTMATADRAATDIRSAIGEVRETVQTAQSILKSAQSGSGTIPMLLANREVAENLRALITNMRRHGVLFYRNSGVESASSQPAPPSNRPNNPRARR